METRHVIQFIPKSEVKKIYDANKADIDAGVLSVWDIKDTDDLEKEVVVLDEKRLLPEAKRAFKADEFGEVIIDRQSRASDRHEWKITKRAIYYGGNSLDFEEYQY